MGKIGLLTFYKDNFGSVLQCYATKRIIDKMGYDCRIIYKNRSIKERIVRKIKRSIKQISNSKRVTNKTHITKETRLKISSFVESYLKPEGFNARNLQRIGKDNEYSCFIVGSDQVWNITNYYEKEYFLGFTDKEKRIAFSVSMGVNEMPEKMKTTLACLIRDFKAISVRERTGKSILQGFYNKEIDIVSDPTIMLSSSEWEDFSKDGLRLDKPYTFVHFIDAPNNEAISFLRQIHQDKGMVIVQLGYRHSDIEEIFNADYYDGDPIDYVSIIRGASLVLTDSYHTILFSILFNKEFRVFNRQYQTKYSQNSRIKDVLELYGLYEYGYEGKTGRDNTLIHEVVEKERIKTQSVLEKEIGLLNN